MLLRNPKQTIDDDTTENSNIPIIKLIILIFDFEPEICEEMK